MYIGVSLSAEATLLNLPVCRSEARGLQGVTDPFHTEVHLNGEGKGGNARQQLLDAGMVAVLETDKLRHKMVNMKRIVGKEMYRRKCKARRTGLCDDSVIQGRGEGDGYLLDVVRTYPSAQGVQRIDEQHIPL